MASPDRLLAMQQAIEDRNLPKVRLLLKAGVPAEHYYHPSLGWSFAKLAARTGDLAIFSCLVDAGANIRGVVGEPMIHEAACSRTASMAIVDKVLAEGGCSQADLDRTLLHASEFGNLEIIDRLLEAGANPRFVDDDGATALMQAVLFRQSAIALRLLAAGADPTRRVPYEEHYKKTIVEVAAINQLHDVLLACGSQPAESSGSGPLPTLRDAVQALLVWDATTAQVMGFSHESRLALPRADSLLELFRDIASGLRTGKYAYSEARGIA